jgi:7,8-dihydro-6-hydroxymethylpterin-pyrophosphokinase
MQNNRYTAYVHTDIHHEFFRLSKDHWNVRTLDIEIVQLQEKTLSTCVIQKEKDTFDIRLLEEDSWLNIS